MHPKVLLGSLCVLIAHTASVSAAPTWCKGGDEKPSYDMKTLYTEPDVHFALLGLVAASCYPESDVAAQGKQLAAARAAWSKKLGLVEDDWADVSEWAHLQRHLRGDTRIDERDRQAPWSAYSPLDQFGILSGASMSDVDAAYIADGFGAKLTQLGRLGYVADCLGHGSQDPAVFYAMCATDAATLDLGKLSAEIRADTTHSAGDRMTARLVAYDLLTVQLPKYFADAKALRAKDPAYATMFALGETAHKEWAKVDPRWISLVADLDDARVTGSRKASAGCEARTWEAWKAVITAIPVKRFAAIHPEPGNSFAIQLVPAVTAEPNGYLAALALNECANLEGKEDLLTGAIGAALVRWPGFRGPRTATQTAILTANLKLDARDATLDFPKVHRGWIKGDGNAQNYVLGVVAAVKVEGESATVTFAKQKVKQTRCAKGHYTSQISQIMSDGTVHYYYVCDTEVQETIEVPPSPPLKVVARYAAGLKAGMTVSITNDVVAVAYAKGGTTPLLVTGIEVK